MMRSAAALPSGAFVLSDTIRRIEALSLEPGAKEVCVGQFAKTEHDVIGFNQTLDYFPFNGVRTGQKRRRHLGSR
jgi:hypothetical protein